MKLRLALGIFGLSLQLACTPGGAGPMATPPPDRTSSTSHASTEDCETALSLVFMDESKRQEIEQQLTEGLVFVSMQKCGEPEPVRNCHVAADYKISSDPMSSTLDKVRSERDASLFAFAKEGHSAFPSGYDVATRTSTFLLDGKSLGNSPTGSGCGEATHVVTAVLVGAFRVAAQGGAEFPAASSKEDEKGVRKAGDPVACKNDGARSKDCRALVAVNLRPLHEKGKGRTTPSEHEQTGIIAPH